MKKKINKFDLVYEQIMDSLAFDFSKFNFKKDENGNVTCTFKMKRDSKELNVITTTTEDGVSSFVVKGEDGSETEMTEKEFASSYNLDYDDFKRALAKYAGTNVDTTSPTYKSEVKSFDVQLKNIDADKENGIKMTKMITIKDKENEDNNVSFIFDMLNDPAVDNYSCCSFQYKNGPDAELKEFKALLDIKEANSVIIKINTYNSDGGAEDILSESDLKIQYPELQKKFRAAIKQMERVIWYS